MTDEKVWELIVKKFSGKILSDENQQLEDWISKDEMNRKMFEESGLLWQRTKNPEGFGFDRQQAWSKISSRIRPTPERKLQPVFIRWAAAACLVLAIVVVYNLIPSGRLIAKLVSVKTTEETKAIVLPDNTRVWLNANSELTYPEQFNDSIRQVELKGEAFFDVTHNPQQPFVIVNPSFRTRVLGTSFDLKLRDKQSSLFVVTGKVRFSYSIQEKVISSVVVEPGYEANLNESGQLEKNQSRNKNEIAWHTGVLEFENEKLTNVVEDMSDYYKVRVDLNVENPQGYLFSGTLKQQPVEVALETVCYTLNLTWKESPVGYTLSASSSK
ncbi:anti-sigma factor [Cytophagales bacterium WSM2-2]|nr:anti-sigma factor [Cytophagales bacterium WSM2-2]